MERSKRGPYRRPGHWQTALRRLHGCGYSDAEIAEILSDLSDAAIQRLEAIRCWNRREVERAMVPEAGGKRWTRRQVKHHRRALGLKAKPRRFEYNTLRVARESVRRQYQIDRRWGQLLPRRDVDGRWQPGFKLRQRETDILCLLRDRGPMTRPELLAALGLRALCSAGRSYMARLQLARLVRRDQTSRSLPHYRLTEGACPNAEPRSATRAEWLSLAV